VTTGKALECHALQGVKVLELSEYVSGPYCGKLFGALGAEVIKLERPGQGDGARRIGPFLEEHPHPETSALFLYLNTNKKSVTLDLQKEEGRRILKMLVRDADILVENYAPGVMEAWGLDYGRLKQLNPQLIMVSITYFGQTGPYRDYLGDSLVIDGLSGYMYVNGDPDREPVASGGEQPEYQGGVHGFVGAMAALLGRDKTGRGQQIDVSLLECMASLHQFTINQYVYSGKVQRRNGNRSQFIHPGNIYACQDGDVYFSANTDDQVELALTMTDRPDIMTDPRFRTNWDRIGRAEEFDELIRPWFRERTQEEVVETCQAWRIPAVPLNDVRDLLEDPHYRERGFWITMDHPEAGRLPYPAAPFRMSESPGHLQGAPLLGQDNEAIYCGRLGFHRQDLVRLKGDGII